MRVHYLQHVAFEGLGSIQPWLESRGARLSVTRLYQEARFPPLAEIDWLIIMGGPMSVNDERHYPWLPSEKRLIADAIAAAKTVLGVCLGAQLIASALGARVVANPEREIGWFPIEPLTPAPRTAFSSFFQAPQNVFHWHGETFDLPAGATQLARSAACEQQAFSIGERILGLQFHLETTATGARGMVEHCADDLAPGRWVQSANEMLDHAAGFRRSHRVMDQILDRLAEAT